MESQEQNSSYQEGLKLGERGLTVSQVGNFPSWINWRKFNAGYAEGYSNYLAKQEKL